MTIMYNFKQLEKLKMYLYAFDFHVFDIWPVCFETIPKKNNIIIIIVNTSITYTLLTQSIDYN
jgi:hypothetical protein